MVQLEIVDFTNKDFQRVGQSFEISEMRLRNKGETGAVRVELLDRESNAVLASEDFVIKAEEVATVIFEGVMPNTQWSLKVKLYQQV